MGKQKRERRKPHKENPTGMPSIKTLEEEEAFLDEDKDSALNRVYEQLQSPSVEEKLSGLQTLESMCCDASMAMKIANDNIGKIIGPLLVDPGKPVRGASASALRRIAENGGDEAYQQLLKQDIMTPLSTLLKRHYSDWHPKLIDSAKENNRIDDEKETLIEAVTLLWALCENDECAIKYSNEENLMSILIKFLNVPVYGLGTSVAAAQCILTLSEDNPAAITELKQHEISLMSLMDLQCNKEDPSSETMLLRTLAGGILMNVSNSFSTEDNTYRVVCKVATMISEVLATDHRTLLNNLTSALPLDKNALSRTTEKKLQDARKILAALQQALEILANLCSEDQDTEVDSDLEDSDPVEEDVEYMEEDIANDKSIGIGSSLPVEVLEILTGSNLIRKVWDKTIPLPENVNQILNENPDSKTVLLQTHTLRCRAFLCLNNLLSNLDIEGLGGVENLYRMWLEIGTLVFKTVDPNDIELLESATSAMRAALQKLVEARATNFKQLTLADIQPMLNGERQCSNANVKVNLIRIVGNLALILSESEAPESRELVKHVTVFLLDSCTREAELWVIAESLDAIMDIYAEDETNTLAAEIYLTEKLQTLVPLVNTKIRQQKKDLGDNAFVVSTVKANLNRFIKYKKRQIQKLT
ncbi:HEAT repeat-containing protein 3 [Cephus cinctus]|uniref:HEAT repeat-containing protein 3 n=1 Tax=Cephus cinctus TaxID=211228 RepID=A0AAJ7FIP6_CEPCN|nr:HEAT repeat-containing protein 3 [Cephus cinctus]